ncbi:MAG: hypothetical protein ACR2NW_07500 [Thermodesulfobacteriota bacterium]
MYIDELITVFESTLKENYPEPVNSELTSNLSMAISNKKYDVQDQALIETVLREDRDSFTEEFSDTLKTRLDLEKNLSAFINSEDGQTEIINLFLKSIEHIIDYYYNNIISKQFSSS